MRVAVISDIHANLHALESVLENVDAESPDAIWCLGDLVGYGPRPNECCAIVRERADVSLVGNHDLASLGRVDIELFNYDAAAAARWTQTVLDDDARAYLEGLAPSAATEQAQLFHASPRDPVWDYVLGDEAALASFLLTTAPLVLVGHSHVALALAFDGGLVSGGLAPAGTERRLDESRVLLNPGLSGSRATAIRAPPGFCSTSSACLARSAASHTQSRERRTRCGRRLPEALATRLANENDRTHRVCGRPILLLVAALAASGCGGGERSAQTTLARGPRSRAPSPRTSPPGATWSPTRSTRVTSARRRRADELDATITAINNGQVPAEFQEAPSACERAREHGQLPAPADDHPGGRAERRGQGRGKKKGHEKNGGGFERGQHRHGSDGDRSRR